MYSGRRREFKINRRLLPEERNDALPREPQYGVEPDERMSVIRLNSTYLDWIDRRFLYRGTMLTFIATATCMLLSPTFVYGLGWDGLHPINEEAWWFVVLALLIWFTTIGAVYYIALRSEYFTYKYWPIRFNLKTRMVHVFRHNGPGGVLSVPWDKVFFHIGHGMDDPRLHDIRGEVMDGDMIVDTFALGHVSKKERSLREMWEFIRRYMDEGPLSAAPHPLERYVGLSVKPTIKNCYLSMGSYYAGNLPRFAQILVFPFVVLYTLTRWIVFHTCRDPVFPPEVEAACQIDKDDPNVWPIPESSAQFAVDIPGLLEHVEARARRQLEAEHGLTLPDVAGEKPLPRPCKPPFSRRVQRWKKK